MPRSNDKPSISRYSIGMTTMLHKDKFVTTSLGSPFDTYSNIMHLKKAKKGRVPAAYAHRPDTISNIFYTTPGYWWNIMHFNGISDPFEELNPGDDLWIPEL